MPSFEPYSAVTDALELGSAGDILVDNRLAKGASLVHACLSAPIATVAHERANVRLE